MKQKSSFRSGVIILIVPLLLMTACSKQQNWPQFRGPERNMLTTAQNLPEEWGNDKNIAWTYKMDGLGFSSPIAWGDKVFITSTFPIKMNPVPEHRPMPDPPPEGGQPQPEHGPQPGQMPPQDPPQQEVIDTSYLQEIYRWQVTCVDLNTGEELWKQTAYEGSPKTGKNPSSTYACETPVTDGKRVYAYFGMHGLFCYDINGTLLWKKDLGVFYTQKGWGTGSSPVLYKGVLYIQNDNEKNSFIVALDAVTGDEKWRAQRDEKTNYSSPIIWKNKIRTELITTGKKARSYDPETGKLLWELTIAGEMTVPSPVCDQELLYVGNSGGRELQGSLFAVKPGAEGDITPAEGQLSNDWIAWTYPEASIGNGSPLLYNGKLYIIGGRGGQVQCLNALTGEVIYNGRVPGFGGVWASPWGYNGKIWVNDENGMTLSLQGGDQFEYASDNKLDGKFWASVAITKDAYIFKGDKNLYCVKK
jgi:outer membrane protein assembly factor BamB